MGSRREENNAIWDAVISERQRLINDLQDLDAAQWEAATACGDWTVHDVLAHIADTAEITPGRFMRDMVTARGDFDEANEVGVRRAQRDTPGETLASLADSVDRRTAPPGSLTTRLVEMYVHGEDIRRALGRSGDYPANMVVEGLRYQMKTSEKVGGSKELVAGLRLVAHDAEFALGEGDEVRGSALALLLAVCGRPVGDDELSGPGASRLRHA